MIGGLRIYCSIRENKGSTTMKGEDDNDASPSLLQKNLLGARG